MNIAKNEYDFYKLKDWVDLDRLHWWQLVLQKETIPFIEKHIDTLCNHNTLEKLSLNPFAVNLLQNHPEKIIWMEFVKNPNAMHVIDKHIDICFASLNSYGKNQLLFHPNFIYIIPKHIDKIVDKLLCRSCIHIIARKENMVFMDLLEKYMLKYPDKIPDFQSGSYFWDDLASNPCAVHIIEKYLHKLSNSSWQALAINPKAISILEENLYKLTEKGWYNLCENPNAIPILKKNMDKINWFKLCNNKNAYQIIEEYPQKISCYSFIDYDNFSIHTPIFEYDYLAIEKRCNIYKEELMEIALHPSRIEGYLRLGIKVEELDNFI